MADDEPNIARTLKLILAQAGYQAAAVFGGESAVHLASEWHPDLFLTDVVMPDLDGVEAAIRIAQRLPGCKILLLSGHAVVHDLMRDARERGYDFPVLLKPIHPSALLEEVDAVLRAGTAR